MDISIVIVSWNVKDKLRANLDALYKSQGSFSFEVIVVDNDSKDGTAQMVREYFSQVRLIANNENLGFAAACNQGLELASGKYLLLLNPDMVTEPDTLSKALDWMKNNPQATVSGIRLVSATGETVRQVRRFPSLSDQLAVVLKLPHLFPGIIRKYLCSGFNYDKAAAVDSLRGAFFMINREGFRKLAGHEPRLDERYFLWFEEVDFCREVERLGGEVWYQPEARCLDHVGQSFKQVSLGQTQAYFRDSMLKYFEKWEPLWQAKVLRLAWGAVGLFIK